MNTLVQPAGIAITFLLLSGCAAVSFKPREHAEANTITAADIANHQLLLNLARESRTEPVYFAQLKSVSAEFQNQTSIGMGSLSLALHRASAGAISNPRASLGIAGSYAQNFSEKPIYEFTPLAGESFYTAIVQPLDPRIFQNLFEQGWEADMLLRTMVKYVDVSEIYCRNEIWRNTATEDFRQSYPKFLALCCEIDKAQRADLLVAGERPHPKTKRPRSGIWLRTKASLPASEYPILTKLFACERGIIFAPRAPSGQPPAAQQPACCNSVRSSPPSTDDDTDSTKGLAMIHLRSFESALAMVALEQDNFTNLFQTGRTATIIENGRTWVVGPTLIFHTSPAIPVAPPGSARIASLQLKALNADGTTVDYFVADTKPAAFKIDSPSVDGIAEFALLTYLFTLTAIDPTKLPASVLVR